jgi:hypothetical protein
MDMSRAQNGKGKHLLDHVLKLNKDPVLGMKERDFPNPQDPNVRVFAKGGAVKSFEGSKKDMAQDKKLAAKNKMSMKQWEKSPADARMDKKVKEGSAKDIRMDKAGLAKANKGRK